MHQLTSITDSEKQQIATSHEELSSETRWVGWSVGAASFLLVGALIVITCGCLCLMIPGVNVIQDVVLRAVVPGMCAILASIPFIVLAVRHKKNQIPLRERQIKEMIGVMEAHDLPEKPLAERKQFVLHNFLDWRYDDKNPKHLNKNTAWTTSYQKKTLQDIKAKLSDKTENPITKQRRKKVTKAIDRALTDLENPRTRFLKNKNSS